MGQLINCPVFLFYLILLQTDMAASLSITASASYGTFPENTTIGTGLLNLTVSGTGLSVIPDDPVTQELVRLGPVNNDKCQVFLNKLLDREEKDKYTLKFRVTDNTGTSRTTNFLLFVTDINDNVPIFVGIPYVWNIPEMPGDSQTDCADKCSTFTVTATDRDRGANGIVLYSMKPVTQSNERAKDYSATFSIDNKTGVVTQRKPADYEKNSYYQFVIFAKDGGTPAKSSNTSLIIQIKDVQDKPPFYTGIPYRATLYENITTGSSVVTVYAQDGDPGVSDKVNYTILDGTCKELFVIDANGGQITSNGTLDRDSGTIKEESSVCILTVLAREITNPNQTQYGNTSTTTTVTVTINDVDDNSPMFNKHIYDASVQENAPTNIPITIQSGSIVAYDNDTGNNALFSIRITYPNGSSCTDFAPWPDRVEGEQTVMIRVNNSALLDYEKIHNLTLHIVAEEKRNSSYIATATVSLTLIDVNDNNPIFPNGSYVLEILENSTNFTSIGTITATDRDSNQSLTYTLSGGADSFYVVNNTGEIYTMCEDCKATFDREKRDVFYLTYVVTDQGGRSNSVPLEIHLLDVNDNAPLFDRNYSASIRENDAKYITSPIVHLQARDNDLKDTNNSLIHYSISHISLTSLEQNFTVNDTTGELFLNHAIDYESMNDSTVTVTVIAADQGVPQLSSEVIVVIDVQDENDNTPEFVGAPFIGSISEDQTSNDTYEAIVTKVNATDMDATAPNNQFNYFITSGAEEKFSINSTSGEVYVQLNAKLDRETKPNYTLMIEIIDRGASPKSSSTTLKIAVNDVNDEDPDFIRDVFSANVTENSPLGLHVTQCVALDKDEDSLLMYTITKVEAADENNQPVQNDTVKGYFIIDEYTGIVSVNSNVDRELTKTVTLFVNVTDQNANKRTRPQIDTASVRITILDVNDNKPVFEDTDLMLNVSENSQNPSILTTIKATDRDENRTIFYNVTGVYKHDFTVNPFHIDSKTGVLSKIGVIDREIDDVIVVTVNATDNGVPPLSNSMNITVNIVDFNDNAPQFNTSSFQDPCYVEENAPNGTIIFNVSASDKDDGPNANISYFIDSGDGGNFTIDHLEGSVMIKNSLDRETIPEYVLYITAKDNPVKESEQKSTSTTVTVIVTDVNDNNPVFDKSIYSVKKREDIAINEIVITVTATDIDLKGSNNSKITYMMDPVNATEPLFKIDSNTGAIKVNMSLRDKVDLYEVNVTALDFGTPRLNGSTTVVIEVVDVNLHPPVIDKIPRNNTIKIFECIRKNTMIHNFQYTDADRGINAEAYFNLSSIDSSTPQFITNAFNISENGSLVTISNFSASLHSNYKFQVQATDRGDPVRKSDKVTITVEVLDVNNNPPYFEQKHVSFTITENEETSNFGSVTAYDKDKDAIKCYNISDGGSNTFEVGYLNGSLINLDTLDYENTTSYNFTIQVIDCSIEQNISQQCDNITIRQDVNDKLNVHITVRDVNDNPPIFRNNRVSTGMVRRTDIRAHLHINLKSNSYVADDDSPMNAIDAWQFYNNGTIIASEGLAVNPESGQDICTDGIKHVFCISPNGTVINNKYFKEDVSGYFIVPIKVNDTAGSDMANLTVYLIGDSQILVMTLLDSKENVANDKDDLLKSFSAVVGYTLVYDKLEDHKTATGAVVSDQSDLHFHVVDPNTHDVLSGEAARRILDTYSSQLTNSMKKYHVSTVDLLFTASATPAKS